MTDKEAMKLALDALELVNIEFVCNGAHHAKKDRHGLDEDCPVTMWYRKAIAALKERLAQPEQEPVAYRYKYPDGFWRFSNGERVNGSDSIKSQALYTTPPQRTWVGLTDEEMHECWDSPLTPLGMKHARMIEAKLKQKNGFAEEKNT